MRQRDALKKAIQFVHEKYPELDGCHIEVAPECDGERRQSWSFGVHVDKEDERYDNLAANYFVGYVHADGSCEGLH